MKAAIPSDGGCARLLKNTDLLAEGGSLNA
jgi:hypothetical protein